MYTTPLVQYRIFRQGGHTVQYIIVHFITDLGLNYLSLLEKSAITKFQSKYIKSLLVKKRTERWLDIQAKTTYD